MSGLREEAARRLCAARARRAFTDLRDLEARAKLREDELQTLAELGAFAGLGLRRREALWQVAALETDGRGLLARLPPPGDPSPLSEMTAAERTAADLRASGLTVGPHPFAHLRPALRARGVLPAAALLRARHGSEVRVAGMVITRQRPGTARGMCFLTLEDETGLCNVVVTPDVFAAHRRLLVTEPGLIVQGPLERRDGVTNLRAARLDPLAEPTPAIPSRDFH